VPIWSRKNTQQSLLLTHKLSPVLEHSDDRSLGSINDSIFVEENRRISKNPFMGFKSKNIEKNEENVTP
jgi:hypothetical protein